MYVIYMCSVCGPACHSMHMEVTDSFVELVLSFCCTVPGD